MREGSRCLLDSMTSSHSSIASVINIGNGLVTCLPLREAPWECRDFGHIITGFILFYQDMQFHGSPLIMVHSGFRGHPYLIYSDFIMRYDGLPGFYFPVIQFQISNAGEMSGIISYENEVVYYGDCSNKDVGI